MAWLFEVFWFCMKAEGMVLAHRDMEGFHVLSVAQGLFGIVFSIAYEKAISCKSLLSWNQHLTFTQLNQMLMGNLQGTITKHIPLWGWGDNDCKTNRSPGCALQEHGAYAMFIRKIQYGSWAQKPAWNFFGDMSHRVSWTDDQSRGSGGRPLIMWLSRGWETVSRICFMCLRSYSAINT